MALRHSELRDAIGDLAALLWGQVRHESVVSEDYLDDEGLFADLGTQAMWSPQSEALFDLCACDVDAKSYLNHAPTSVLRPRSQHFTPLHCAFSSMA